MNTPGKTTRSKLIAYFDWQGKRHQKTFYSYSIEVVKTVVAYHYKGATNIQVKEVK